MKEEKKKFLIGIVLPVLLITGFVLSSEIDFNKEKPEYDFLYFIDSKYIYGYSNEDRKYMIDNGKMEIYDDSLVNSIRLYDVSEGSYKRVTKEEIESYQLETQSVSPDGFSFDYGTRVSSDFLLFPVPSVRKDYGTLYLKKDGTSIKLSLGDTYYYNQRDMFIGWVYPVE